MAEKEDARNENVDALKRRGRRRLVGAIALVLAAVIVLPMIFDSEPRQSAPPVSVRIPAEDATGFAPKVTPKTPAIVEPAKPRQEHAKPAAEPKVEPKPEPVAKAEPRPEPERPRAVSPEERAKAEAALTGGGQYMIPVGAFVDPSRVIEKLKAAGIPHYTEAGGPIKEGKLTRVRAGPFATEKEAEKTLEQLKTLDLKPGKVTARS